MRKYRQTEGLVPDPQAIDVHACISEETHKRWAWLFSHNSILSRYGMTGFGKTTHTTAFAEPHGKDRSCLISDGPDLLRGRKTLYPIIKAILLHRSPGPVYGG